ncbi:MAG: hypothetical protein AAFO77_14975 [Pseudomonadota bacterium]
MGSATLQKQRYGVTKLSGPAVERSSTWADNNHAQIADEETAIANMDAAKDSFVNMQKSIFARIREGK